MIGQAREIDDGATLDTDVCVIGSGPAGLALAQRLERQHDVLLLESGGFEGEEAVQSLYRGTMLGRPYHPLEVCRQRFLGGSSNCWGGLSRRLGAEDFVARSWVPQSGWPLSGADLEPWYAEAETFLDLRGPGWDPEQWSFGSKGPWPITDPRLRSTFLKVNPLRLGTTMRPWLEQSRRVRTVLGASVVDIRLDATATRVERLAVRRSHGEGGFAVRARRVVLACGGIENARLLLVSNTVQPLGVGNTHGLVGRYFMEHLNTDFEGLLLGSPNLPDGSFYLRQTVHDQQLWGCFELAADVREREGLLAAAMVLLPGQPDLLMEALRRTIADTDNPGAALAANPVIVSLGTASEQAPNPESRVVLSAERDRLGVPRVALDWRLTEQDQRSLARTHAIFAEAIAYSGLGRVKVTQLPGRPFPEHTHGGRHHLGTTRMHQDPRLGVVDANAKVHGVDNLFVAGSSVFPTGGAANPTLTIVALARRLAAHLAEAT